MADAAALYINTAHRTCSGPRGCTPGQLALAWVLAQGDDIVPIPGTKRRTYLEENVKAVDVKLSREDLAEIDAIFPFGAATGARYVEVGMKMLNG